MIVFAVFLIVTIILTFVFLMMDLLDKGCLAWHRDSIGTLIEKLIFSVCFLLSLVYAKNYIHIMETNIMNLEGGMKFVIL